MAEVALVSVADHSGNSFDAVVGAAQQVHSSMHPHPQQMLAKTHADRSCKLPTQVCVRRFQPATNNFEGEIGIRVMLLHDIRYDFNTHCGAHFENHLRLREGV